MAPLHFIFDPVSKSIFGGISNYGLIPAFFTDEIVASNFFEEKQAIGIFARCDHLKSFRSSLEYNESAYVMVDLVVMTLKEFTERFSE